MAYRRTTSTREKTDRIPIIAQMKPCTLKANYAHGSWPVSAYTERGAELKRQFLKDGACFLRAVGAALAKYGFTLMSSNKNEAGIAVSGEVTAEYWHPAHQRWLYCWLEASVLSDERSDRVCLVARWREPHGATCRDGANHIIHALSHDSAWIAQRMLVQVFPKEEYNIVFTPIPADGSERGNQRD